jgi:putative ABC transport system permease protein
MVGIVAGLYPSLYLSSLNPSGIFRGKNPTGSKTGFIKFLTTIQFGIAIFFLISTVLLIKQMNYIRTKDLGLNDKNVVVVPTGLWYGNKTFKDELLKNPNILSVSASVYAPVDFSWQINLSFSHEGRADSLQSSLFWADEDFAKTYNLKVKKGQFLQMDYSNYWKEMEKAGKNKKEWKDYAVSLPIVINETAEKMLGFNDPIGQRLGDYMIVGVVKDFHFRPLHYPIGPLILTNNPENIMTMNIRITPVNRAEILKYIGDTYRKYRNLRGFSYSFFDDLLDEKYQSETRLRNLTFAFAVLAIVIAMLGILGMSLFACQRRTKEIGIRKVNGAKVAEVMAMLNKDFIKWVAIAFVIACPIAWYAMHKWLQNFAYKTELSWWVFAGAGAVAVTVAALTVSWQSWRAATRNPVESLRYE